MNALDRLRKFITSHELLTQFINYEVINKNFTLTSRVIIIWYENFIQIKIK